jgi:hypothetical protein
MLDVSRGLINTYSTHRSWTGVAAHKCWLPIWSFPQSRFGGHAALRVSLLRRDRLRLQLKSLIESVHVTDDTWLEFAPALLKLMGDALSERLDDIQLELENRELEEDETDPGDEIELGGLRDELSAFAELPDATDSIKDEYERIAELLEKADRLLSRQTTTD